MTCATPHRDATSSFKTYPAQPSSSAATDCSRPTRRLPKCSTGSIAGARSTCAARAARALAFGTPAGRLFTLFLALPFGGAFVLLKGLEEINDVFLADITGLSIHLTSITSVLLLGVVALGIINYVRFRHRFLAALGVIGRALRVLFLDLPSKLFGHPLVHWLLTSKPALYAWRFVLKPGLLGGLVFILLSQTKIGPQVSTASGLVAFLAASFLFNT